MIGTFDPSLHMWLALALAGAALVAYAHPRIPLELTSVALIGLLLLIFYVYPLPDAAGHNRLGPLTLLRGFANPALIAVLSLLVVGQGMVRTGALDFVVGGIYRAARGRPSLAVSLSLLTALVVSAVLNNTPVVVMFIPILVGLAERLGRNVSRIMLPLSYVAILGGMTTLIGSSTNLLVSGAVTQMGLAPLGFFDFTVPGLVLAAVGIVYTLFLSPRLLREGPPLVDVLTGSGGRQFVAQLEVEPGSPLTGAKPVAGMFQALPNMTVLMVQRDAHAFLPPFEELVLEPGDVVVVAATRKALTEALARSPNLRFRVAAEAGSEEADGPRRGGEQVVAEVMVAPASRLIGLPLAQIGFPAAVGCVVLAIQRRSRMLRARMSDVRLEAGDVLLVQGPRRDIEALRNNRDVLLMEWSAAELPTYRYAGRASAIFLAVVGLAASGLAPITVTAVAGAAVMIITGCLNVRQAARALDRQVVLIAAAALALDAALQETGGAGYIAQSLVNALQGYGPAVVLSAFFLMVGLLTNVLSNQACAVLFTPIAINVAQAVGVAPLVFVIAVVMAANCSFATPIGYITNILVMGPGRYRFVDYLRAGSPLIILLWITFSLFAPWYYGL